MNFTGMRLCDPSLKRKPFKYTVDFVDLQSLCLIACFRSNVHSSKRRSLFDKLVQTIAALQTC